MVNSAIGNSAEDWTNANDFHYNVIAPDTSMAGFLINQRFYDGRTGLKSGYVGEDRQFFLRGERAGVIEGMQIVFNDGLIWRLVRVPF